MSLPVRMHFLLASLKGMESFLVSCGWLWPCVVEEEEGGGGGRRGKGVACEYMKETGGPSTRYSAQNHPTQL